MGTAPARNGRSRGISGMSTWSECASSMCIGGMVMVSRLLMYDKKPPTASASALASSHTSLPAPEPSLQTPYSVLPIPQSGSPPSHEGLHNSQSTGCMAAWPRSDIFSAETRRPWTTSFAAALASRSNLSLRVTDVALSPPADAALCTANVGRRPGFRGRFPRLRCCAAVQSCWPAFRSLRGVSFCPCLSLSALFSRVAFAFSRTSSVMFSPLRWIAGALPSSSPEHLEQVPPQAHLRWIVFSCEEDWAAASFCWFCGAIAAEAGVSSALRWIGDFSSAAAAGWLLWLEHLE